MPPLPRKWVLSRTMSSAHELSLPVDIHFPCLFRPSSVLVAVTSHSVITWPQHDTPSCRRCCTPTFRIWRHVRAACPPASTPSPSYTWMIKVPSRTPITTRIWLWPSVAADSASEYRGIQMTSVAHVNDDCVNTENRELSWWQFFVTGTTVCRYDNRQCHQ